MSRHATKYVAIAAASARRVLGERAELVGLAAFLLVILFIFSRLWAIVLAAGAVAGAGPRELIWYLAVTEWCVLAVPAVFLTVERDIRSGDIACQLVRPVSYVGARIAEALGECAPRLIVLGAAGVAGAWLLAGGWPSDPRGLVFAVPLGLLSVLLAVLSLTAIGLSAFWLVDTGPVYWIWSKLAFVLGGLFLPLEVYPGWLRGLARFSPFPAMLWGPGSTAFGWAPRRALETGLELVAWMVVVAAALAWLHGRAQRRLTVHGG